VNLWLSHVIPGLIEDGNEVVWWCGDLFELILALFPPHALIVPFAALLRLILIKTLENSQLLISDFVG
jgi:hypothetical protein